MAGVLYIKAVFWSLVRRANATFISNLTSCTITWVKRNGETALNSNRSILSRLHHTRWPHRCVQGPHPVCKTRASSVKTEDGTWNVVVFTVASPCPLLEHQDNQDKGRYNCTLPCLLTNLDATQVLKSAMTVLQPNENQVCNVKSHSLAWLRALLPQNQKLVKISAESKWSLT